MNIVKVNTKSSCYNINISSGRLKHINESIPIDTTSIAIITNNTISSMYIDIIKSSLKSIHKPIIEICLPEGEEYKNLHTLNIIFDNLLKNNFDRKSLLIAFGGGVIGDITGFAASVYMRGIRFIQIPTTLLAQIDSSVGGKTAVNHILGKNMIGSFYQPISVEIDIDVLNTLPKREISAGLAEMIKYGLIIDKNFWEWCENHIKNLINLDQNHLIYAIKRSCELKSFVVSKDEKENNLRAILNFGHTFGHAIESVLGYGKWLHGEAVACGMIQAAELSSNILNLKRSDVERIRSMIKNINCPILAPKIDIEKWLHAMKVDKKNTNGEINFVLLPEIGSSIIKSVSNKDIINTILITSTI
ncbi:3-dehydroquinate synthase [Candidatus Kinetoplastibacterium sorsogonicusi]|uniref:3-dehydroquinate synthase n=1 Tax=Candidatus Kinetoplastidibacterium kentomonadis TaxID=1576550 RepID=A0A3Q8ERS4_9PROT|nr:3-dehydroquinate synthase [Candidatus Kinetoplastibacterium sorsogonicusi]AWD32765.1 3-dehydroquinate synthase [Candidatus Kinetoplastibacterium sorsogonicusi]